MSERPRREVHTVEGERAQPTLANWVAAARPRTLPAAVVPVAVGIAIGRSVGAVVIWHAVLAMAVSLLIQIGTNYANDYSDGIRGTDEVRVGPMRLVASKTATPGQVRAAAIACFVLACGLGLIVALATSLWLILVGAACVAAGWLYTGGPKPYGYLGLGEVFVFVFFGPVAVLGTAYVCVGHIPAMAWLDSVPVGALAVALLVVNNLRDIEGDERAGKRTLAVKLGDRRTRALYIALIALAYGCVIAAGIARHFAWIALASILTATVAIRAFVNARGPRELIAVLGKTGGLQLVFGALFAIGIAI